LLTYLPTGEQAFVINLTTANTVRIAEAMVPDPLDPEIVFHLRDSFPLDAEGCKKVVCWLFFLSGEKDGGAIGTVASHGEEKAARDAGVRDRSDAEGSGDSGYASGGGCEEDGEGMLVDVCDVGCEWC
jgi:hypothetical protein